MWVWRFVGIWHFRQADEGFESTPSQPSDCFVKLSDKNFIETG